MFWLLWMAITGLFVGLIARMFHSGDEPAGCLGTILIGIAGSYIGGLLNWAISGGQGSLLSTSGFIMSIIGGVIFCYAYSYFKNKK